MNCYRQQNVVPALLYKQRKNGWEEITYYELLDLNQRANVELYIQDMHRLSNTSQEK